MNFNNNPILYPKDDGLKPSKDNGNPPCYPKEDGLNPFKAIVERINALESAERNNKDSFETKELNVTENAQIKNLHATEGTVDTLNSTTSTITNLNSTTSTVTNSNIKNAEVEKLNATEGTINTLNSTTSTVTNLNSTNGNIKNAEVEKLNATEGTIANLNVTTSTAINSNVKNAEVEKLNVTENAQIKNLNATEGTVDTLNSTNCNIKNAQIENLHTNKLTWDSPSIDVENVKVKNLNVTKEIKVENLKTEEPISSNAVVGYDGNGKMIPIKIAELEEKVDKDLANATGTLAVANGGTGVTTQADINKAFIGNLNVGNDDVTDGTEFVSSYVSDSGFSSTDEGSLNKPYKRQFIKVWNYIKGKISSVLGLTETKYNGTAVTSNKIEPNYTSVGLSSVTSPNTIKYIKLADCDWSQTGTLQVRLNGNNFEDTLVINFGGGNGAAPMLCGYYTGYNNLVLSVITQNGPDWNSNYSIYVKVIQLTTLMANVALLKGDCTINISESTTAPTNISEWAVAYGLFGNLTGNVTGNSATATSVVDYGDSSKTIKIGYTGAGATVDNLSHIAGYLTGGTQIKNVSKSVLRSWLGLDTPLEGDFDYTVDSQQKFNDLLSILKSGTPSTYRSIAILGGLGGGEHGEYLYTVDSNSSDANLNNASLIGFNNAKIVITINNANTFKVFKNGLIKDIDFNVGGTVNAGKTVTLLHNCTYNNGKIALNNVSATFNIVDTTLSNVINDECKSFVGCILNDCETIQSAFTNCSSEMLYVSTDTNIANKYSFNKCGIHLDMKKTNMTQLETVTINIASMTDSKLTVLDTSSKLKKIILNVDASDSLSEIVGNNDKKYSIYEPFVKRVSKSVSPSMRSKAYLSYHDESHTPIFSNDGVKFYLDEAMTQQIYCYSTTSNNKTIWMFSLANDDTHCYSSLTLNKEITYSEKYAESVAGLKLSDFGDEFILNRNPLKTYICRNDESGTLLYSNNNGTDVYISPHINDDNKVQYANTDSNKKMFILGNFTHFGKILGAFNEKPLFETIDFVTPQLLEVTALKDNYAVQVVSNYDVPINVENAFSTKVKNG